MTKLIEAFKANPSKENAIKVWRHFQKHPMSVAIVSSDDRWVISKCLQIATA